MALTKIGSIGINTGIQFAGVTTISTLNSSSNVLSVGGTVNFVSDVSIGGTVSIAGTLTYEDVTNVDAVGLITARDGIKVGSGITLSPDGDIFATGITTITGEVKLQNHLRLVDNKNIYLGTGSDLEIRSGGNDGVINQANADLKIQRGGSGKVTFKSTGSHFIDDVFVVDKIAHDGDTNTAIRFPTDDTFTIETTGTERLRIEPAGNVKVSKNLSVTGIATVGSAVTISESGIEASGIGITCANINGGKIGGRRNLIINGAMVINQRNASTTSDNGFGCDRWQQHFGNTDESPTLSQADVASGTEPYNIGLRKCLKLTNGNQTSGAGITDYMWIRYRIEAQDIINSGWNYTSSTSFLTLSFYIKSSVAQNFYGYVKDCDGSPDRTLPFETGSLTADTWKRVSVLIPGDSGLQFDNNSGRGFEIFWGAFVGTYYSSNSSSVGTWKNYTDNDRLPDSTTTWYTTNDATLEITGVQLELGTEATPFELRTFAEDYRDCLRYYYESRQDGNNFAGNGPNSYASGYFGFGLNGNRVAAGVRFPVPMRGIPSITIVQPSDGAHNGIHRFRGVSGSNSAVDTALSNVTPTDVGNFGFLYFSVSSGITQGAGYLFHIIANAEI